MLQVERKCSLGGACLYRLTQLCSDLDLWFIEPMASRDCAVLLYRVWILPITCIIAWAYIHTYIIYRWRYYGIPVSLSQMV